MAEPLNASTVKPAKPGAKKTRKVLVKKAKEAANTKKYIWLAGHGLTLAFGGVYHVFYNLRWFLSSWYWTPRISYRLAFIGVILSYSITVVTTFGGIIPGYHTLLATENFQNLILALIWLISRPSAFKLLPYYSISLLQIAKQFNVKPILKLQDALSDAIATCEIVVIIALLFDTLLFRGTSGFALAIYLMFYWLRINFSPYTQAFILRIVRIIDEKVMVKQKPETKAKWQKVKDFVEFRRNQTNEMYEKSMEHEPDVVDTATHGSSGRIIQEGKQMNVAGDQQTDAKSEVPPGVNVRDANRKLSNATSSTTASSSQRTPKTPSPASNTQKLPLPQQAGESISNSSAQAQKSASQTSQASGRIAIPEAVNRASTQAQDSASKATAQVQTSVAQASGRISTPGSPSPSKQHSLDPRQTLIDHAQKLKTSDEAINAKQSAQTELQKVQQAAQSQIANTQNI